MLQDWISQIQVKDVTIMGMKNGCYKIGPTTFESMIRGIAYEPRSCMKHMGVILDI